MLLPCCPHDVSPHVVVASTALMPVAVVTVGGAAPRLHLVNMTLALVRHGSILLGNRP